MAASAAFRLGHARILAPSGSYSGSRATSKPTHSPKTSTSPRAPDRRPGWQVRVRDRPFDGEPVAAGVTRPTTSPPRRTGSLPRQTERGSSRTRQRSRLRGPAALAAMSASRPMKSPLVERDREPEPGLVWRLVRRDVATTRRDSPSRAGAPRSPGSLRRRCHGRRRVPERSPQRQPRTRSARRAPNPARRRTCTRSASTGTEPTVIRARGEVRERRRSRGRRRGPRQGSSARRGPTARSRPSPTSRRPPGPSRPRAGRFGASSPGRGSRTPFR